MLPGGGGTPPQFHEIKKSLARAAGAATTPASAAASIPSHDAAGEATVWRGRPRPRRNNPEGRRTRGRPPYTNSAAPAGASAASASVAASIPRHDAAAEAAGWGIAEVNQAG